MLPCSVLLGIVITILVAHASAHKCDQFTKSGAYSNQFFVSDCETTSKDVIQLQSNSTLRLYACHIPTSHKDTATGNKILGYSAESVMGRAEMLDIDIAVPINFDVGDRFISNNHICLEGTVVLRDPGEYEILSYFEYDNYEWNIKSKEEIRPPIMQQYTALNRIVVSGISLLSSQFLQSLPICKEIVNGRFVNGSFLPFDCKLRIVTLNEFQTRVAALNGFVEWFGDSNSRRMMKALDGLRNNASSLWCSSRRGDDNCVCEDVSEPSPPMPHGVKYYFMRGLIGDQTANGLDRILQNTAKIFVIASLVNWDSAFTKYDYFDSHFRTFVDRLKIRMRRFAQPPLIIFRTGNYFCCTHDSSSTHRMVSRKKQYAYHSLTLKLMEAVKTSIPNLRILNAYHVGESLPLASSRPQMHRCASNHFRSEIVDQELQMMLNLMFNP